MEATIIKRTQKNAHAPSPWPFGIASMSYGSFNGLVAVALPYVLRKHGIPVDRIAAISAMVQIPAIWYFLWAPVVDVRFRRRTWVVLLGFASAACAGTALSFANVSATALTALLVTASVFNQPVMSAIGGLIASVVPDDMRGRTSGWSQAGTLLGGVGAGGLALWLTSAATQLGTGLALAALIGAPALGALIVCEPPPKSRSFARHLADMWGEVAATLKRRESWLGLLFFFSPAGAGALMNLFTAVSPDFHASTADVYRVIAAAGILTPAGALFGGLLCDRFNRWRIYPVAGLAVAAAVTPLFFMPLTPAAYLIGAAGYAFTTGICYAVFMALALELVGDATAASGTRFTLFMAAVNVPVVYMLRLDGLGHARFGVRGMIGTDAAANVLAALVLLSPFVRTRTKRAPQPQRS